MIKIFNEEITDVNKLNDFQMNDLNKSGIKYNDETDEYSAEGTLDTIVIVDPDVESDDYLEIVQSVEELADEESKQDNRVVITCPICGETFACEKSYIKGEIASSVEDEIKEVEDELDALSDEEIEEVPLEDEGIDETEENSEDLEVIEDETEPEEEEEV